MFSKLYPLQQIKDLLAQHPDYPQEAIEIFNNLSIQEQMIDNNPLAVILVDAQAPDLPIVYVNSKFEENTGYSKEESIGKNCRFLQGDDHEQDELDILREALAKKQSCVVTVRNYRKDGTLFWNELHLFPIYNAFGTVTHFSGVQHDITEMKDTHARDFDLAVEKERSNVLSQFIQDAAHEFRTPLTIINSNTYLITRSEDVARRLLKANEIEKQVQRISRLLNMLLALTKLESSDVFSLSPLQLRTLILSILKSMETSDGDKPQVTADLAPNLPRILGDVGYLEEAFRQLLENAYHFTPPDGSITITMDVLAESLCVRIQDTGEGIAAEDLPRIFDRFWRKDEARSTPGFGLGLTISRQIIELHNGTLTVESVQGQGTTFSVCLPIIT